MQYWPEGTGPLGFWESRFQPIDHYEDNDRIWPMGMAVAQNVGYVIPFMHCPEAVDKPLVDSQFDAEMAFFDSAANLKHSICENSNSNKLSESAYGDTIYAILHPDAVTCLGSNGITYDRSRVLQSLGYWVKIWEPLVALTGLEAHQPYLYQNVETDVGLKDLIKLNALLLDEHELVVLLDPTVLIKKPLDLVFDSLRASNNVASYVIDPETGGISTTMLIMKPAGIDINNLVDVYTNVEYDLTSGWGKSSIGLFPGGMGTSGLLTYYFENVLPPASTTELDNCLYLNSANKPCDTTIFEDIVAMRMTDSVCDQPWKCSYSDKVGSWDISTKSMCEHFFMYWTEERYHYESIHWTKRTLEGYNNGTHHQNIYTGYCEGPGVDGYIPMIRKEEPVLEICSKQEYVGCEDAETTTVVQLAGGVELDLIVSEPKNCDVIIAEPGGAGALVKFEGVSETRESSGGIQQDTSMVFVIDRSGSTCDSPELGCASDENYDLQFDDILDCEIAAVLDLVSKVRLEGIVKQVGLVSFSHTNQNVEAATIELPLTNIEIEDPHNRFHEIEDVIREVDCDGATNYAEAVKLACLVIDRSTTENNVVVFISDGKPTQGGAVEKYCDNNAIFHTIALGPNASCESDYGTSLQTIADATYGTCQEVPVHKEIRNILKEISNVKIEQEIVASVTTNSIGIDFGCDNIKDWVMFGTMDCSFFEEYPTACTGATSVFMGYSGQTACCVCGGGTSHSADIHNAPVDLDSTSVAINKVDYTDTVRIPPGEIDLCTTVTAKSAGVSTVNVQCKKVYICPHPTDGIPG